MQIPLPPYKIIQHNRKLRDLKGEGWFIRADVGIFFPLPQLWISDVHSCVLFFTVWTAVSTAQVPWLHFPPKIFASAGCFLLSFPQRCMYFKDIKIKKGNLKEAMSLCTGICVWQSLSQKLSFPLCFLMFAQKKNSFPFQRPRALNKCCNYASQKQISDGWKKLNSLRQGRFRISVMNWNYFSESHFLFESPEDFSAFFSMHCN